MLFWAIFAIFDFYFVASLIWPLKEYSQWLLITGTIAINLLLLTQAWFFYFYIQSKADEELWREDELRTLTFWSMGLLSFLLVFTFVRDLILLVGGATHLFALDRAGSSVAVIIASFTAYALGAWSAKYQLTISKVKIPIQNLPRELENFRIVQLSDIHIGTGLNLEMVREMVDQVLKLKPDLIALTGDIIDGEISRVRPELSELSRLKATYGAYYTPGNHEYYWNPLEILSELKKCKIHCLVNEGTEIKINGHALYLAGVADPTSTRILNIKPEIPTPPKNVGASVLLAHQPQFAEAAEKLGYQLQLSGHTHGGQFFPWNLLVRKVHAFHAGLDRIGNMHVYVNVGTGYWGPPLRLGSAREITEIQFSQK